jgi:transposase InsO family protein
VDSGSTNHVCNSLQGFQETRRLNEGEMYLTLGDGTRVPVHSIGIMKLYFNSKVLILTDCLHVPNIRRNLISVTHLGKCGYTSILRDIAVIKKNRLFICSGVIVDGLYIITPDINSVNNSVIESAHHRLPLKRKFLSTNDAFLWHLRLGHINTKRIQRLVKDGLLGPLDFNHYPVCESCLEGKMTKRPFSAKGHRATDLLELVHTDVCGPMSTQARGGYEYFITFTDDYSRYGYVYLMRRKSESFEKFKEFRAEAEKQLGKHIRALRSDRGGEYFLGEFKDHLSEAGIVSQLTAPGTPQQNGVSERRNRTLLEMVRAMMSFATLPTSFWGYALETAAYLLNLVPSKSVSKVPFELWTGRKPSINMSTSGDAQHMC